MKATCPHCGTYGPVELFMTDDDAKRAVVAVGKLPGDLPRLTWSYLGLFRKPASSRVLTWERVGRIVAELAGLVAEPETAWKGQRVVPNRADYWAQGMQAVLDRDAQGKLERPLDGHNYLRAVVYEIAEKAWHQGNVRREKEAQTRQTPPRHCEGRFAPWQSRKGMDCHGEAPRNDGEKAGSARTTGDDYQPLSSAEALNVVKRMREKLNGGCHAEQTD